MFQLLIVSLFVVYCNGGALSGGYGGGLTAGGGGAAGLGYGLGSGLRYGLGNGISNGYGNGLGNGLAFGNGLALGNGFSLGNGLGNGLALGNGLGLGNGVGLGFNGLGGGAVAAPLSPAAPIAVSPSFPVNAAIQSLRTVEVRPLVLPQEPVQPQIIEVEPQEIPVQILFRSAASPVLVQQIHTPGAPSQVEATQSEEEPQRVIHEVFRPIIQEVREVIQPFRRVTQEVRPVLEEVHTVVAKGEGRVRAAAPVAVGGPAISIDAPSQADVVSSGPLLSARVPYAKARAAKAAKA